MSNGTLNGAVSAPSGGQLAAAMAGYSVGPGPPPPKPGRGLIGAVRDFIRGAFDRKASPELPLADQIDQYIQEEKAAAGPKGIVLPWFLPWINDYTGETTAMRLAYRQMLRDPNVKAALLDKLFAVAQLELSVTPASPEPKDKNAPDFQEKLAQHLRDKRGADFVKDALTKSLAGGVRKLVEAIGYGGLIDGYSVCEKVWVTESRGPWRDKYVLRTLKAKDTNYDVIPMVDEFRNVVGIKGVRYNAGEVFNPNNFVFFTYLPLFENPGGMSDLRAVYSRFWLLDTVLRLRAILAEKRAMPVLIGQYATAQQAPSLEQAMTAVRHQTWMSIPLQTKVEALDIASKADDIFASFVSDLQKEIRMGISGAILQAMEGTLSKAHGDSKVHEDTASLFKWYLSSLLSGVLQAQVVPDLIDLNFVDTDYPLVNLSAIDENEMAEALKIDQGLHDMGVDLSKEDLYERYRRTPPVDDTDRLPGAPPKPQAPAGGGQHPFGNPNVTLKEVNGHSVQENQAEPGVSAQHPFLPTGQVLTNGNIPTPKTTGKLINIPFRRQDTPYNCGAAAFQAVLNHFGVGPDKEQSVAKRLGTDSEAGTRPSELLEAAEDLDLRAAPAQRMTLGQLRTHIDRGQPVLCPIQMHGGGHWVVAKGYSGDRIHLMDPVEGDQALPVQQFVQRWWDHDADGEKYQRYGIALSRNSVESEKLSDDANDANDGTAGRPEGPAKEQVAGRGNDRERAKYLLKQCIDNGVQVMAEIAGAALERSLPNINRRKTLFTADEKDRLARAIAATNATAELLGRSRIREHERKAIEKHDPQRFAEWPREGARFFDEADLPKRLKPKPPEQALDYFKSLVPLLGVKDPGQWQDTHERQAFTLAAATEENLLRAVKDVIQGRLDTGQKVGEAPRDIQDLLEAAGVSPNNPQYSQLVFRTNAMDSYTTGTTREMQDPDVKDTFPVWKFLGIADGRERESHAVHDDHYFANDVTFAEVRDSVKGEYDGYNCRHNPQPIDKWTWQELQAAGAKVSEV